MKRARWERAVFVGLLLTTATVTCWSPTEMVLDISTDVECGRSVRTGIAKGAPLAVGRSFETTTETCIVVDGRSEIGTLTVVPSGERDGRASVRVVAGVGSFTPERCLEVRDDPELRKSCIYASRTFSFLEHSSRRLPIFLSKDCFGRICAENETCVPGGACELDEVVCTTQGCGLEIEIEGDGGFPTPDAIADAIIDKSAADAKKEAGDACTANGVIVGANLPLVSAVSPSFVYYATGTGLFKVAKEVGSTPLLVRSFVDFTGASLATTLATENDKAIVGLGGAGGNAPSVYMEALGVDSGTLKVGNGGSANNVVLSVAPIAAPNVFAGTQGETFWYSGGSFKSYAANAQATVIGATSTFLVAWYGAKVTGVPHGSPATSNTSSFHDTPMAIVATKDVMFASAETVNPLDGGTDGGIFEVKLNAQNAPAFDGVVFMRAPKYLAVDGTYLYWIGPTSIDRVTHKKADGGVVAFASGRPLSQLMVDPEDDGCIYYWSGGPGDAKLHVLPKPK